ncbi:unnamed protein product [Prorocentrum cordatum]|uniref:Uncharacterized protein n=1 Tax=Prorocentrum cordatum TaxID=2364126 RepID=A0ABN9UKE9_9DINO|nr:unnamed protein product [Polarella glacialis]
MTTASASCLRRLPAGPKKSSGCGNFPRAQLNENDHNGCFLSAGWKAATKKKQWLWSFSRPVRVGGTTRFTQFDASAPAVHMALFFCLSLSLSAFPWHENTHSVNC